MSSSHLNYPLTLRVVGAPQMISQPVSPVLHRPLGLDKLQACRFPMLSSHLFLCLPWYKMYHLLFMHMTACTWVESWRGISCGMPMGYCVLLHVKRVRKMCCQNKARDLPLVSQLVLPFFPVHHSCWFEQVVKFGFWCDFPLGVAWIVSINFCYFNQYCMLLCHCLLRFCLYQWEMDGF